MKKDMILHTRNEEQCALGRTRVRPKAHCSAPWGVLRTLLLLLMMTVGVNGAWGQETTDYSGVYYIGSVGYNANNPANNFYLCPSEDWLYYKPNNEWSTDGTTYPNPFLTTYKCKTSDYHSGNAADAVWVIKKHSSENFYYIIHKSTGKYMVSNGQIAGTTNANRMRVHLETIAQENLDDKELFSIEPNSTWLVISPKSSDGRNGDYKWYTVNGGNQNFLVGKGKDGGPTGHTETGGILGTYTRDDANAKFYLEDYIQKPTIFYNTDNKIQITVQNDATIIYTTDGTDPTNDNGTQVDDNTVSFHIDEIKTIKAVAVVEGFLSKEIAVFTPPVLLGNTNKYLIQSQNNAWNSTDYHFYMIPGDVDNNIQKVNTTSLFRPSMEWHFESAGLEDGVQFYYFVNNSVKDNENNPYYLCYDGTNNVHMETFSSDDKFKFRIMESPTAGTYNIRPYGNNNYLNKASNNDNASAINLNSSNTSGNTRWKFVTKSALDQTAPFTVSDASTTFYYKINSVGSSGYYIVPPSGNNTNATTSNSTDANVVKTGAWYFEEAQAATDDDWLTYYYIRNAETGKYLYFTKDANNDGACLIMKETIESNEDRDRYMFTWARTATQDTYYIVPKKVKDKSFNQISSLQRNGGTLQSNPTRGAGNYAWTFTLFCNDPVFEEEGGVIKIKCHTNAANIYINTENDADPTVGSTLYDPTQVTAQNWTTNDKVRIKAIAIVNDGTTTASSSVVTLLNKPDVTLEAGPYTYKGTAWEPSVTSVSIGETVAPTSPATYTVAYSSNNTDAGTANVTITDNEASDAWYIWNVPVKEFTIDKKDLTITANPKTIGYGDEADNDGVTYGEFAGSETETVLGGTLGYSYTTKGDNPQPYTPYDPSYGNIGEYDITPHGLISQNYNFIYIPGTMTVTKKSIGDGSLAPGFTLNFDESGDVILKYGTHTLTKIDDYTIGDVVSGEKYSSKTISGTGNYSGYVAIRNAIVHFTTDANQEEWSATFVAESSGGTDIGHALPEDITAYIISGIEGDWAIPEALDYIPAGVPVLLVTHEAKNGFLVKDASNVTAITPEQIAYNKLKEVTGTAASFATREIYVLYNNEFVLNMAGNLSVGKVYMENPTYTPSGGGGGAPIRLKIKRGEDTGIEDVQNNGTMDRKNDIWYTIDGQRLSGQPNTRGLYINGGKKIMVK